MNLFSEIFGFECERSKISGLKLGFSNLDFLRNKSNSGKLFLQDTLFIDDNSKSINIYSKSFDFVPLPWPFRYRSVTHRSEFWPSWSTITLPLLNRSLPLPTVHRSWPFFDRLRMVRNDQEWPRTVNGG